jgi:integrase
LVAEFGEYLADDFDSVCLEELQERLIGQSMERQAKGKEVKLWSRHGINKVTMIVRRCFRWAQKKKLLKPGVWGDLKSVELLQEDRTAAREIDPVGPVPDANVEKTLPKLSPMIGDMVRVQRLTGCRPGELLTMTREAIDTGDPECWAYSPGRHKTSHHGKSRTIFIGPRCQEILKPWLLKAGDGRMFPVTRDGYRRAVSRASKRAGVKVWVPNQLRHTLATEVRSKFGLETAQVMLGHSRADTTQIYAERDFAKAREAARMIG